MINTFSSLLSSCQSLNIFTNCVIDFTLIFRYQESVPPEPFFSGKSRSTFARHLIPAKLVQPFAANYIKVRFHRSNSRIDEKMCKKNLEGLIADESQLSTICKALLLHATVEKDVNEIRNLGIATIETYDKSQTKYMLFQAVLNHITKPTYTIEEIKKYALSLNRFKKNLKCLLKRLQLF